jgi:imidazolonepropionase-like amidohydrolase
MVYRSALSLMLLVAGADAQSAGEPGGVGLAVRAAKVLTASFEGEAVIDHGVLLVKDGRVEAVGRAESTDVPDGYEVLDVGDAWVSPGMIDLHCHVAGPLGDLNDAIYQANPGLRASATVLPLNVLISRTVQGGVTTVLLIPGSATNMGGQGILLKTGFDRFEDMRLRDPGSLKVAQGDNPTRWGYRMGRGLMNHHIRATSRKGIAYARAWEEFEAGRGPKPEKQPQFEIFRALKAGTAQISTHTQAYTLVMNSILLLKGELGFDTFIDHGEWAGYKAVPLALEHGVAAICGPRELDAPHSRAGDTDGKILGVAAGYQERGLSLVGFNTDSPVVPGETLPLQAATAVRYGFDDEDLQSVKGVTIVPAIVAGIDDRVGSLEPGKDADLIVTAGDPLDPRSGVQLVFIEGRRVYAAPEVRTW